MWYCHLAWACFVNFVDKKAKSKEDTGFLVSSKTTGGIKGTKNTASPTTHPTGQSSVPQVTHNLTTLMFSEAFKLFISSVQLLSCVWLFMTPWTVTQQASLSITNSRSLPKLMSIESVMPCNHFILCCPLLLLPSNLSQHQGLFKSVFLYLLTVINLCSSWNQGTLEFYYKAELGSVHKVAWC